MSETDTTGIDVVALMKQVDAGQETMQLWSDEKRADFTKLFAGRARAAKYILLKTAVIITETARRRRFIGERKVHDVWGTADWQYRWGRGQFPEPYRYNFKSEEEWAAASLIGGRSRSDLDEVAETRAKQVIDELPVIKDAVKVIAPDIAKKIDRRDDLLEKGKKVWDELGKYDDPVYLSDFKGEKIETFIEHLKTLTKQRRSLVAKLNAIGEEGCELDEEIDRALFRGLPGLDDAIKAVVKEHIDRANALDQFNRRVEEKVKFGDSAAAVDLLREFEKDERAISSHITTTFQNALQKLSLLAKSGKSLKQLQSKGA